MNRRGQAAKLAYDPAVLALYVQSKSAYHQEQVPCIRKGRALTQLAATRTVNGIHFDQATDGRTLRRWRTTTTGVTGHGAQRFLERYGLSCKKFERWAKANNLRAILWGAREEAVK